MSYKEVDSVVEKFLRYVKIDTQSDPESKTYPSTEKQKNLGRLLVDELKAMGLSDAEMDEHAYVYATLPANSDKDVPVICFCSHMDTSPDCSGKGVNPVLHDHYDGADIQLPADPSQVIRVADYPHLAACKGQTIITSDGSTLLGADDKAGIAEIMSAVEYLVAHPEIKHGKMRILFTPDEEVGRGVDKVDMEHLGADYGYTVDGELLGSLEDETFSADGVTLRIKGVIVHPGFAKGKLENALKIAGDVLTALPKDSHSPETTEGREGFVHPYVISGNADEAEIKFIIRSFETAGLKQLEDWLEGVVQSRMGAYPGSSYEFIIEEQYRNMKEVLDKHPNVTRYAGEAIKRSGVEVHKASIRGGTDGSRLSFMGLPCPNLFAGGHAFHSRLEWVCTYDMKKAVEMLINLMVVWEEHA